MLISIEAGILGNFPKIIKKDKISKIRLNFYPYKISEEMDELYPKIGLNKTSFRILFQDWVCCFPDKNQAEKRKPNIFQSQYFLSWQLCQIANLKWLDGWGLKKFCATDWRIILSPNSRKFNIILTASYSGCLTLFYMANI